MSEHEPLFPVDVKGLKIHLVGIKGTGMTALAEILKARGAILTGSDVPETFYTDNILQKAGITVCQGFSAANIPPDCQLAIRSAAWNEEHPEVSEIRRRGIPLWQYTEALGEISLHAISCAIAGVHGKTSTTAMTGSLLRGTTLPFTAIVGSGVTNFDGSSTWNAGDRYLVAETCEYRRHFLSFNPRLILLTSVEEDHLDYFKDLSDIESAFIEFGQKLPHRGTFIFCTDDPGSVKTALRLKGIRPDIRFVPYGESIVEDSSDDGRFMITKISKGIGETRFTLAGFDIEFVLKIPGRHMIGNAAGAVAAAITLCSLDNMIPDQSFLEILKKGLMDFRGTRRRSEIRGMTKDNILVMDDYGHHPTAVRKTLEGLKEFYPDRRLVVDFMSHTYSRTRGLLKEFSRCFNAADMVILNKVYPSARESGESEELDRELFRLTSLNHPAVHYFKEPDEAVPFLVQTLKPGDLFITMGAGNNWTAGELFLKHKEKASP